MASAMGIASTDSAEPRSGETSVAPMVTLRPYRGCLDLDANGPTARAMGYMTSAPLGQSNLVAHKWADDQQKGARCLKREVKIRR
jgi:hypothetical protein